MTRSQFAMAVMADEKWIENAARILNRRLKYSLAESVWLGLVRMLTQELQVSLARAAELADQALGLPEGCNTGVVAEREDGNTAIVIDMARFRSSHAAALSTALTLGGARRRGRQRTQSKRKSAALERASRYGVDLDLLREGLKLSVAERLERADENAGFITSMRVGKS